MKLGHNTSVKGERRYWRITASGTRVLALTLCIFFTGQVGAGPISNTWSEVPKERKLLYTNLGVAGFITVWGVTHWDYFQSSPTASSEGWFESDTEEGGADKLGHAYTSHVLANALAALYQNWGYEHDKAGLYGALSAFGLQTFMEFGDSFSRYGFSYEDFLANGLGSAFGYLYWRYPALSDKLDFRWEYKPDFKESDVFTDYQHHKYLIALKLDGFERLERGPLRYVELQAGYYARNYDDITRGNEERNLYVGVAINLSHIASEFGFKTVSTILNYYQVPYTYVDAAHDFED